MQRSHNLQQKMSRHIIKKKQLPVAQIKELFSQLSQYLPQWLLSPTLLVRFVLNTFNDITIVVFYLILLGQTARFLVKQRSYVNTKVLMTKWIIFLFFQFIFSHVTQDNVEGPLLKSLFLMAIFALIYSFKVSKTIFQNYFKGQQMLKESSPMAESFIINNNTLIEKFLVVVLVHWLKFMKYLLNYINSSHRKTIQDEIKEINLILTDQTYFQKREGIQQRKGTNKNEFKQSMREIASQKIFKPIIPQVSVKIAAVPPQLSQESEINFQQMIEKELTKGIIQVMDLEQKNANRASNIQETHKNDFADTTFSANKKEQAQPTRSTPVPQQTPLKQSSLLSKQKKYKKYAVSQYLPLFSTTSRSSAYPNLPNKRCTYYRQIEISYDVNSAVMTVTSLEDMKVSYHSLEEIALLEELMIQFQFEQNQQMMVKFKNRTEYEEFITSIDIYESSVHNK